MATSFELHPIDIALVCLYFVLVVAIGVVVSKRNHDAQDYFLAGRRMTWPIIGVSLFASNISSTTLVGFSGDAYATGISVYNFEWTTSVVVVFAAVFFLPTVIRAQVYTMPEYLERRFDRRARTYFSLLTLFLNIVVDTAGTLFAGALLIKLFMPDTPLWMIITALAIIAGAYTTLGGLTAVMITDVIQAVLLLIGSIVITIAAYDAVGGWSQVVAGVPADRLSLIRPPDDDAVPWPGLVSGVLLLGFYFWCTNQFMVQRVLSAKDLFHARFGYFLAALLKLPVLFLMVMPGTFAILLYPNLERPDLVYPTLMLDLLPVGVLGLTMAGFLAALMSQIDSTLNSASTLVTMDFLRKYHPELDGVALMRAGRITVVLFLVLAILSAPQIEAFPSLFKYLISVLSYAIPPAVAMFLVGLFWKGANATGAFWTVVVGLCAGVALFVANVLVEALDIHFLYVAPILFVLCCVVLVAGSLTSKPNRTEAELRPMMWTPEAFQSESQPLRDAPWYGNYRIMAAALMILTMSVVVVFW